MSNLTPKQQRESLLVGLYEAVHGSASEFFKTKEVAAAIGLEPEAADDQVIVLKQSGLVDHLTMGGSGVLTDRGIAEAERLQEQQAAPLSVVLTAAERADLEAFVGALRRSEIDDRLEGEDLAEYQADLRTAEAQVTSPRPKRAAVRAVVSRLVDFVGQTGAAVAATVIAKAVGM